MANQIEEAVAVIAEAFLQGTGLELVDVEYVKEHDWYLRIFIDKEGGIEIDDCQQLSEKVEEVLDKKDIIKDSYILEVSSPGLDRVLKKDKDFVREKGKKVDVTLYAPLDGEKLIVGVLEGKSDSELILEDRSIALDKIAQVRLHIDF